MYFGAGFLLLIAIVAIISIVLKLTRSTGMKTITRIIRAIVATLLFGGVGFLIGYGLYCGLCEFFSGVWDEVPWFFAYAPIYILTIVGLLGGLISELSGRSGVAVIFQILAIAIALIVALVLAIIIGGIISQDAYWIVLMLFGLLGGGGVYIIVRFIIK